MTMRLMRMRSRNGRGSTDGPPPIKDYKKKTAQNQAFMTGNYMSELSLDIYALADM